MDFVDSDWWKSTKWFKLFLGGCLIVCVVIAIMFGGGVADLSHIESTFRVDISVQGAERLHYHNTQGWFGDGEEYSVWQYNDTETLLQAVEWSQGAAFRHDVFTKVTTEGIEQPDGYSLPREMDQEVSYYYQDDNDNELLLIYAPEARLGDGVTYQNLLFVAAWYS